MWRFWSASVREIAFAISIWRVFTVPICLLFPRQIPRPFAVLQKNGGGFANAYSCSVMRDGLDIQQVPLKLNSSEQKVLEILGANLRLGCAACDSLSSRIPVHVSNHSDHFASLCCCFVSASFFIELHQMDWTCAQLGVSNARNQWYGVWCSNYPWVFQYCIFHPCQ